MALSAVTAEALKMGLIAVVASGAVEGLPRGAGIELFGASNVQPLLERLECSGAFLVPSRCALQSSCAEPYQFEVIHHQRPNTRLLMFDVARRTFRNARMERRGLTTEESLVGGVAGRALGYCHAHGRLVT